MWMQVQRGARDVVDAGAAVALHGGAKQALSNKFKGNNPKPLTINSQPLTLQPPTHLLAHFAHEAHVEVLVAVGLQDGGHQNMYTQTQIHTRTHTP